MSCSNQYFQLYSNADHDFYSPMYRPPLCHKTGWTQSQCFNDAPLHRLSFFAVTLQPCQSDALTGPAPTRFSSPKSRDRLAA